MNDPKGKSIVRDYAAYTTQLNDTFSMLQDKIDTITTADPDRLHWGHIGSMLRTLEKLGEALDAARWTAESIRIAQGG